MGPRRAFQCEAPSRGELGPPAKHTKSVGCSWRQHAGVRGQGSPREGGAGGMSPRITCGATALPRRHRQRRGGGGGGLFVGCVV